MVPFAPTVSAGYWCSCGHSKRCSCGRPWNCCCSRNWCRCGIGVGMNRCRRQYLIYFLLALDVSLSPSICLIQLPLHINHLLLMFGCLLSMLSCQSIYMDCRQSLISVSLIPPSVVSKNGIFTSF